MKKTVMRNETKMPLGFEELEVCLTEAIREFSLSRERIKIYDATIKTSQARTRATLDQVAAQRDQFAVGRDPSENEMHEREKIALRLENQMLRFERRLPQIKRGED